MIAKVTRALSSVVVALLFASSAAAHDLERTQVSIAFSRDGRLAMGERNALLAEMTDEVAALVLRNNYLQPLAISLSARRGMEDFGFLQRLILPAVTLSVIYIALIARITRTSVLDVMNEDYIRTARAKGQVEIKVLFKHALKNAAVPIVTVIGLGVALLIGGVVVTESVFTIPGLGRLTVDAVLARDYPTIQAVILLFSFVYVLINLLVDVAYTLFDPRIRY